MPSKKLKPPLSEWEKRVKNEYNRLCKRKQEKQADIVKNTWNRNR